MPCWLYSFRGKLGWVAVAGSDAAGRIGLRLRHMGQMCPWSSKKFPSERRLSPPHTPVSLYSQIPVSSHPHFPASLLSCIPIPTSLYPHSPPALSTAAQIFPLGCNTAVQGRTCLRCSAADTLLTEWPGSTNSIIPAHESSKCWVCITFFVLKD